MKELIKVDLANLNSKTPSARKLQLEELHVTMRNLIESGENNIATEHEALHAHGLYVAVWKAKAGSLVEGSLHKYSHLSVLLEGVVQEATPELGCRELTAGHYEIAPAGLKRTVFCVEDCVWLMVHPTNETDPTKVKEEFIAKDYKDWELFQLQIGEDYGVGSDSTSCDRNGSAN